MRPTFLSGVKECCSGHFLHVQIKFTVQFVNVASRYVHSSMQYNTHQNCSPDVASPQTPLGGGLILLQTSSVSRGCHFVTRRGEGICGQKVKGRGKKGVWPPLSNTFRGLCVTIKTPAGNLASPQWNINCMAHVLTALVLLPLLLLVCVSFTIIGQPWNSVLIRRV